MATEVDAVAAQLAGFWRRLFALIIDFLVISLPTFALGVVAFDWAAGLGQAGRLVGFVIALAYFGLMNSTVCGGQTMAKRWLGLRVVDRDGSPVSPLRSAFRFLVLGVPIFLNGTFFGSEDLQMDSAFTYAVAAVLALLVFGGLGSLAYLYLFNRRTRQSLHDLVAGTYVVRAVSVAPITARIARVHLRVVGAWCLLVAVAVPFAAWKAGEAVLGDLAGPLTELQAAIAKLPQVGPVSVFVGSTTTSTVRSGTSTVSHLTIGVWLSGQSDPDRLADQIAGIVLERQPKLFGQDLLEISVRRGFDLGLASWSNDWREALPAGEWRQRLLRSPTGSRSS